MAPYIIFFVLICSILTWVTIQGTDAFPFSHYPMFSNKLELNQIKFLKIALETENGQMEWWESEFYRYPRYAGKKLGPLYNADNNNPLKRAYTILEKKRVLLEVCRLIETEYPSKKYNGLHIIERKVNDDLDIIDTTIEIIPLKELKDGKIS